MKKTKERGITLIALVVTIVVLLILAGVSISMLTGENGVIAQANASTIKTDNGTVLENLMLKISEDKGRINEEKVTNRLEQLKSDGIVDESGRVNCESLIGKKLKTGNGNTNDIYVIENDELYYYDKNGNKNYLGNVGKDEEIYEESDPDLFDITEDGTISIKREYGYYEDLKAYWTNWDLEELVIPSEIRGIKVKRIKKNFWSWNEKIKKIYIPSSVTTIDNETFDFCKNLVDITIGNGVTSIGINGFNQCLNLKNIVIGNSITDLDWIDFRRLNNLTNVVIGDGITSIKDNTFAGCNNLTDITIGNGVTSIGAMAFARCSNLKEITIPESVTSIGDNSFIECNSLTTVNYKGTQEQWNNIVIDSTGNSMLLNATINYNYTGE